MRRVVAQARLAAAAAVVSRIAPLRSAADALTSEPILEDARVGEVPCLLARPAAAARRPAIVFANGVTARGRDHPVIVRLAYALARTGHLVLVPDPPGLSVGEIGDDTVAGLVSVALAAAGRDDSRNGRVGLLGVSVGASLALLAAADERLAGRVSVVAGIAPYTDLSRVVKLATTGHYPGRDGDVSYPTPPFLLLVVARSLLLGLPSAAERARLRAILAPVDVDDPDPLAGLRAIPADSLEPGGRALVDLLLNRDRTHFPVLYERVPAPVRDGIGRLSPIECAERLRAPVEIATAPTDKYFPLAESEELADAAGGVRITVTGTLAHAIPDLSLATLAELLRLDGFGVRVLEKAWR
ncbi:MAG TPA: hypothetical protein VFQ71_02800 [Gaiellales bacterium]|jgi:acetyl esterase/lipase|nr:hypothetical protein [Gaiellales bacterium]